ncbi:hypothetical protein ACFH04_00430 [Streptomyces noboritoensis]|uniref:Proteasome subunit alpha n=1 Tax=Streptomyces noboritoensis TaxID=67337 RepID=A0ABV6T8V6_9ACTN
MSGNNRVGPDPRACPTDFGAPLRNAGNTAVLGYDGQFVQIEAIAAVLDS